MEPETKTLKLADFEWKAPGESSPEGSFVATFATLNVPDHHGDVTVPGAFEDGKTVPVGGYQHDMFTLPVGKAVIRQDDRRAWIEGAFNLKTAIGRDTYETVRDLHDVLEWSYVFTVLESADGEFDSGGSKMPVRYLKKLDVWSVDPVLRGAGIGTGTDVIKSLNHGLAFADHAEQIAGVVDVFAARVKERLAVRVKEGRQLSLANVDRLGAIAESLKNAAADLEKLIQDATPAKTDMGQEFVRFQRSLAALSGVPVPQL